MPQVTRRRTYLAALTLGGDVSVLVSQGCVVVHKQDLVAAKTREKGCLHVMPFYRSFTVGSAAGNRARGRVCRRGWVCCQLCEKIFAKRVAQVEDDDARERVQRKQRRDSLLAAGDNTG